MITNMLTKSQQFILASKGFYKGPIDGVWTAECQDAMNFWSLEEDFAPAAKPTSFFVPYSILPKAYQWQTMHMQRCVIINPKVVRVDYEEHINRLVESCESHVFS